MFRNRSFVPKGGHSFEQRIDILSGNRSFVRKEDIYSVRDQVISLFAEILCL